MKRLHRKWDSVVHMVVFIVVFTGIVRKLPLVAVYVFDMEVGNDVNRRIVRNLPCLAPTIASNMVVGDVENQAVSVEHVHRANVHDMVEANPVAGQAVLPNESLADSVWPMEEADNVKHHIVKRAPKLVDFAALIDRQASLPLTLQLKGIRPSQHSCLPCMHFIESMP